MKVEIDSAIRVIEILREQIIARMEELDRTELDINELDHILTRILYEFRHARMEHGHTS